jgi:uncharacterized protein (DUF1778 family)
MSQLTRTLSPSKLQAFSTDRAAAQEPARHIVREIAARPCSYGNLPYTKFMADSARLEARLSLEVHTLLKRAAEIEGRSLTDFVVNAARDAARRTLEGHSLLQVSLADQERVAELLENPPEPTAALRRAFARRRELFGLE